MYVQHDIVNFVYHTTEVTVMSRNLVGESHIFNFILSSWTENSVCFR